MVVYRPQEFAQMIGKSVSTLRRWDKEEKLIAKRSIGGQRYYDDADYKKALKVENKDIKKRQIVVYCRVSSQGQLDDLQSQIKAMEQYCLASGIPVDLWIQEIGGGLNFKRKQFLNLMKSIRYGEVEHLIIAHKDRLARFGFDFISEFCSWYNCELTVVNQESLSPQQEMVEDLMAIIHCFSCRLYGLRSYKKGLKKVLQDSLDKPTRS